MIPISCSVTLDWQPVVAGCGRSTLVDMSEEEDEFDAQLEFYECCRYADEDTGLSLLQNFPNIDVAKPDEFGTTPLHAAAANGLVRLLQEMVKRPSINLNVATPGGNTPLHFASINRNTKIIEVLVQAGADVKAKNAQGKSPLFEAMVRLDERSPDAAKAVDLLVGPDSEIPPDIEVPDDAIEG
jgi:ankyrin repeat protein